MRTSPFSATFTSQPGKAGPTVPKRYLAGRFMFEAVVPSVRP
jgi:hypothetical protein